MNRLLRDLLVALALGGLLALLPAALRELFGRSAVSYLTLATNALLLGVLALSWDMLARTGQLSLAHAAFTGVGAYSAAVLLRFAEVPVWLGIPLGGVLAALLALVLGAATLRLYGIYFAIATLAFTEVLRTVVQKLPAHIAGGAPGINVPPLFRPTFVAGQMERWEVAFLRNQGYFWVYLGLLVLAVAISIALQRSRLRSAFTAIRTNEEVAGVMGVNPARTKLVAFAVSSFVAGLLGAVEAHRLGSVSPDGSFAVHTTVLALVTPIFGGLYTTVGPILGAGVLAALEETLKRNFSEGYLIGYGIVLVASILFMPRGLVGLLTGIGRRLTGRGSRGAGATTGTLDGTPLPSGDPPSASTEAKP